MQIMHACMGWLKQSNAKEKDESKLKWTVKQDVEKKVAYLVLETDSCLYSQWFAGKKNVCTDSLSRDGLLLTHKYHLSVL